MTAPDKRRELPQEQYFTVIQRLGQEFLEGLTPHDVRREIMTVYNNINHLFIDGIVPDDFFIGTVRAQIRHELKGGVEMERVGVIPPSKKFVIEEYADGTFECMVMCRTPYTTAFTTPKPVYKDGRRSTYVMALVDLNNAFIADTKRVLSQQVVKTHNAD